METWKKIEGFNYEISNLGNCRNSKTRKAIKPVKCTNGYYEYQLYAKGKRYCKLAHRLVATAFIPNLENKREVNHKDCDVTNNRVENLEWVTPKENCAWGDRNLKCREANRDNFKAVRQYDKEGNFIKEYECIADASKEIGILPENISRAIRKVGGRKYAKGFIWEFVEQDNQNRSVSEVYTGAEHR